MWLCVQWDLLGDARVGPGLGTGQSLREELSYPPQPAVSRETSKEGNRELFPFRHGGRAAPEPHTRLLCT